MIDDVRSPRVSDFKTETKPKPHHKTIRREDMAALWPRLSDDPNVDEKKLRKMLGDPLNVSHSTAEAVINENPVPATHLETETPSVEPPEDDAAKPPKPPKRPSKIAAWWAHRSKRQRILIGVAVLLILGTGSGTAAFLVEHGKKPAAVAIAVPKKAVKKAPVVTTVPNTLTGLPVDPSVNQRPVTGVMIENSTDARPQSGLDQAGVVFEAIAEGGITRFLALYQDTQPNYIGPVRSSRPYYVQWALGFDAGYAHVGGSPEALQDIKSWNVRDLDQFYNSGAYQRISSRYAPHNVYTSISGLNQLETSKGYASSTFTGFERKKEAPVKTPTASSIDINFSGTYYNTHYDYDAATNSYKRSEAGAAHMELNSAGQQTQITPKVVVALVMSYSLESDGYHSDYQTIGTGQMYVFQDGTVTTGTWAKTSNTDQFKFTDSQGHALKLNPGQTWVAAVGNSSSVAYK